MDGDEKPMSSQRREQVLENCRWLFGQEVQLITFYHTFNNGVSNACTALILPKSYSLHSQSQEDFNAKILLKAECKAKGKKWVTREDAINNLLWAVESKVGEILQPDTKGEFQVNKSAIPETCKKKNETEIPMGPEDVKKTPITPIDKVGEPIYELDSRSVRGEKIHRLGGNKKIWRIAGYTSSGEPCIEEYEPEGATDTSPLSQPRYSISSAQKSRLATATPPSRYVVLGTPRARLSTAEYAPSNTETDATFSTPGTPVISDVETAIGSDGPGDDAANSREDNRRLNNVLILAARAGAKFAELQGKRALVSGGDPQAPATPTRNYQQILDEQELAVKDFLHWIKQKNQRIMSLEIELKEAQIARDAGIRMCAEVKAQLKKETLRADESEAREMDTNALLERLFRNRSDSRSVRSGLET